MIRVITLVALFATASAMCPNKCSGHGTCGTNDDCTCYANWQGVDCSARTCPFAKAWVDSASAVTTSAHSYAECSNHGTCDRDSGQCECSDGFEGRACDRVACPSGCSGKGTCEYVGGSSWDSSKTRACKCDPGYGGIDCSASLCPLGDDIMTTLTDPTQAATTDVQEAEVQSVAVVSRGAPMNSGNVTFTYTDLYGGSWTTRPILLPIAKAYVNTNEYVAGTATGAGTTATEDIKMGTSITDTSSTKSAQAGTYYPLGSTDATDEGGYAGLSVTSTTGTGSSNTHHRRVMAYEQANQEITVVGGGLTATTSSTTFALLGGKIAELQASNGQMSTDNAQLEFARGENERARETATELRNKANADYEEEKADMEAAIEQMNQAIDTLSAIGADQTAAASLVSKHQFLGKEAKQAALLKVQSSVQNTAALTVF